MLPNTGFLTQLLTSTFPGEVAKRFPFVDGAVGIVYTEGWDRVARRPCNVVLVAATFPARQEGSTRYFGVITSETCVGSVAEAAQLIASFTLAEAVAYRVSCQQ